MSTIALLVGLLNVPLAPDEPFLAHVRETEPLTPHQQLTTFHLPPGFEIQLFAAEPDIQKPMNMAFDGRGRLWVSGSVEYPYAANGNRGRDTIKILKDTDGDGRADWVKTFVDGLNIPIGLYPFRNGVIAYSIPNIYLFQDLDGDDRCDRRDVLYGPLGDPRDTHGLQNAFRRGFDGWLYINHGFANDSTIKARDGTSLTLNSGNVYRVRTDGSRVEPFTWGQVNPFGSAWTSSGDLITADCHSKPLTLLLRAGYYSSFGKPHDGLGFAPELMQHHHGSTGLAGVAYCGHSSFPDEYQGSLFLGNVVTSRVHRDTLAFTGASPRAVEQKDFVTTDDPWFRPVDLCMGPDGALYIADFYNRVIGHYEVPLDHPGRDRHRGRIWRVVYRGDAKGDSQPFRRLDNLGIHQLIQRLGDANLSARMLAMDQLSDRFGQSAAESLRSALRPENDPTRTLHAAWTLLRINALRSDDLFKLVDSNHVQVRLHAMRMLAQTDKLTPALEQHLQEAVFDKDAHVRRVAAEALGAHPEIASSKRLLRLLGMTPHEDAYLRHTIRIALRNQLRSRLELINSIAEDLTPDEHRELASVALAIPNSAAASLILDFLQRQTNETPSTEYLTHAAQHLPVRRCDELARLVQQRVSDLALESSLYRSIRQAMQASQKESSTINAWGRRLVEDLVASVKSASHWEPASRDNPWGLESRRASDGGSGMYLSSLPGGEQMTGTLRSRSFKLPERLSFYLCGHRGFPEEEASNANLVRLVLQKNQEVIKTAYPPRNDTAQLVDWDLSQWAGQSAVIELVDGMTQSAFAWLAVARFEPDVIQLPSISPNLVSQRQQLAAELIGDLQIVEMKAWLAKQIQDSPSAWSVRAASARALLEIRQSDTGVALIPLIPEQSIASSSRERICQTIIEGDPQAVSTLTGELFRALPLRHQATVAREMSSNPKLGQAFLHLLRSGEASTRLLQVPIVFEQLKAALGEDAHDELEELLARLPAWDATLQANLTNRLRRFRSSDSSVVRGVEVFKKHCATCHQVAGEGTIVGPQLDGIGTRGAERVIEDLLAPYRNVDSAFRTSILSMNDGQVMSGLVRSRQAGTVLLVNSEGKQLSLREEDIEEVAQIRSSIMPENFAQLIPDPSLNDLIAYLMSLRTKPQP